MSELPKIRILVAEDNDLVAKSLKRILGRLGYEVVGPVPTVEEALALVASETLDMAVLDVTLKGGHSSLRIAEALHQSGCPFIFATGHGELPFSSAKWGDVGVLLKPFTPIQLREVIAQVLQ